MVPVLRIRPVCAIVRTTLPGWFGRGYDRRFPVPAFLVGVVVISFFELLRIHYFVMDAYDLGIFDQAVRRYAHFQALLLRAAVGLVVGAVAVLGTRPGSRRAVVSGRGHRPRGAGGRVQVLRG